jgi:recombination protein RecT
MNQLAIIESKITEVIMKDWNTLKKYSSVNDEKAKEIVRTAHLAVMESNELQKCLQSEPGQISFIHSMKYALRTGLSLNPQEGKSALIPYAGKVTYQIMKNGYIEKTMQSGFVKTLSAKEIKENDTLELWEDENGTHYKFTPALTNRGIVKGYLAVISLKSGETYHSYMTVEEVKQHQKSYVKYKSSAWDNSFDGMALKTVIKKLLRNVNISAELSELVGVDDSVEVIDAEVIHKEAQVEDIDKKLKEAVEADKAKEELTDVEKSSIQQEELKLA